MALKATRSTWVSFFSAFFCSRICRMCQEIASPSRSGSVARISLSAFFTASAISLHDLLGLAVDVPVHREVVVGLDRAVLGRQIADVAEGRDHLVAGAQVLVDGLGLGGRFDDDDVHLRTFRLGAARQGPQWASGYRPAAIRVKNAGPFGRGNMGEECGGVKRAARWAHESGRALLSTVVECVFTIDHCVAIAHAGRTQEWQAPDEPERR